MSLEKPQSINLGDGGENQHCFSHRECGTDANAGTGAERQISETRPAGTALLRKPRGLEPLGIFPKRRIAVQHPRNHPYNRTLWNALAANLIIRDRLPP